MSGTERIRVSLDGPSGGWWAHIDVRVLDDVERETVAELLEECRARLTGEGIEDADGVLRVLLLEQLRDEPAYQRVAESRGVLAL